MAHTGLDDLSTAVDLWRGLPMDDEIDVRMWRVPSTEVPRDAGGQVKWLDDWWQRIDDWIAAERGARAGVQTLPGTDGAVDGRRAIATMSPWTGPADET